jgi:site-specific recombinase XerD
MEIPKYIDLYRKDLKLKNYAETSIENYVSQVKCFLYYYNNKFTEPAKINELAIKDWLLLANSVNGRKHRISALKLFYHLTIKQPMKFKYIEYPRSEKKLPIVLSQDEVQKMFTVCTNSKHKAILAILYSCGLRVGELINLQWKHIDRSRMIINVIAAKGMKDRQVMLTPDLIPLLEKYYREYKSVLYVFNGQGDLAQYSSRSVGEVVKQLAEKAGINKRVYSHLMRHNCFTHMMENGIDLSMIQKIAGHNNIKTTSIYTHISHNHISKIQSPLAQIRL